MILWNSVIWSNALLSDFIESDPTHYMTMFICFVFVKSSFTCPPPQIQPHPSFHLPSDGFHTIIGLQAQLPRRLNGKQRPTLPLSYSAVSVLFSSSKAIFITQHISLISSAELFIPTNHINGGIHLCWTGLGRKVLIYVDYGGSRSLKWRWTFLRGGWDGARKGWETVGSLGFAHCLYPKGSLENKYSESVAVYKTMLRTGEGKSENAKKKEDIDVSMTMKTKERKSKSVRCDRLWMGHWCSRCHL